MHVSTPATDVVALADAALIPGLGYLPVSAYLLSAEQPVLVDTGLPDSRSGFLEALWNLIDPADLRWIYLTHPDRDHTGSLMRFWRRPPPLAWSPPSWGWASSPSSIRSHPVACSCSIPDSHSMSETAG